MDVAVDTSTWIHQVFGPRDGIRNFVRALERLDARAVIPRPTLDELFAVSREQERLRTAANFAGIWRVLDDRLVISDGPWGVFERELDGALTETPLEDPREVSGFRELCEGTLLDDKRTRFTLGTFAMHVGRWKQSGYADALAAAQETREHVRKNDRNLGEAKRVLLGIAPTSIPPWIVERVLGSRFPKAVQNSEMMLRRTDRYHAIRTWAAHFLLAIYGDSIPSEWRSKFPLAARLATHRNNFMDAAIAAVSSYSSVLLTEDENFAVKCNHLRLRKCGTVKAIAFDQFVSENR